LHRPIPYGQNIHLSQFPDQHRRFDRPCQRKKAQRLNQKLKLTATKPRLNPPPNISLELRQADPSTLT